MKPELARMSWHTEIDKLNKQSSALMYLMLFLVVIGVFLAFFLTYTPAPILYITYPNHMLVAESVGGKCVKYPTHVPHEYRIVWVSPKWTPCKGVDK